MDGFGVSYKLHSRLLLVNLTSSFFQHTQIFVSLNTYVYCIFIHLTDSTTFLASSELHMEVLSQTEVFLLLSMKTNNE